MFPRFVIRFKMIANGRQGTILVRCNIICSYIIILSPTSDFCVSNILSVVFVVYKTSQRSSRATNACSSFFVHFSQPNLSRCISELSKTVKQRDIVPQNLEHAINERRVTGMEPSHRSSLGLGDQTEAYTVDMAEWFPSCHQTRKSSSNQVQTPIQEHFCKIRGPSPRGLSLLKSEPSYLRTRRAESHRFTRRAESHRFTRRAESHRFTSLTVLLINTP
jgi:hypothetical protein